MKYPIRLLFSSIGIIFFLSLFAIIQTKIWVVEAQGSFDLAISSFENYKSKVDILRVACVVLPAILFFINLSAFEKIENKREFLINIPKNTIEYFKGLPDKELISYYLLSLFVWFLLLIFSLTTLFFMDDHYYG